MTLIECDRKKCINRGTELCSAGRVSWKCGSCQNFSSFDGASELAAPFNPRCEKKHGKYKSTSPGRTLK